MLNAVSDDDWSGVGALVAERLGLHFPPERIADLKRGVTEAARELGFESTAGCVAHLRTAPLTRAHLDVLACQLTIGETYFFREPKTLDCLADTVLPALIAARGGSERRLRLWSAACATGEEPYSLAILLHRMVPDLASWNASITATDINPRFLKKAVAGLYGEWSFRDVPEAIRARYFRRTADGRHAVLPEIRRLVTFEQLNLVDGAYPALATGTNAMDVIFCRNVLMYFTAEQTRRVIARLHDSLIEGGWLVVSPSEASHRLFTQFETVNFPGAILFRKPLRAGAKPIPVGRAASPSSNAGVPLIAGQISRRHPPRPLPAEAPVEATAAFEQARSLYVRGRYAEAAEILLSSFASCIPTPAMYAMLTRALANQGRLSEALHWCDRWLGVAKLDAAAHYLRAVVLMEQGEHATARTGLQRAVYLDPGCIVAHYALGNVAVALSRASEARKHFHNALRLLGRLRPDQPVPEGEGLSAGRLTETLNAMLAVADAK